MKALLGKLLTIQKAVDSVTKSEKGFNYSYAGQEQVLGVIRPIMNAQGLLLMQEVLEVENTRIDYTTGKDEYKKEKSEILTSAKQLFTWIDVDTNDRLEVRFHANGMNDWEKGLGSALTYAERYFLLKFFHIPTPADDPDARQSKTTASPAPTPVVKEHPNPDSIPLELECCTTQDHITELWTKLSKAQQVTHQSAFTTKKEKLTK